MLSAKLFARLAGVVALCAFLSGGREGAPRPARAQQSQLQQDFFADSSGKRVAALTIFSDHSETLEFLTSKGDAFARLSDRGGANHLDLLSSGGKAGICVTAAETLKISAGSSNDQMKTVVDDEGLLGAAYSHPGELRALKINMRGAVPITASDGTEVALVANIGRSLTSEEGITRSFDIMIRLFGPSGGEWCYVKVQGGTFESADKSPTSVQVPRYTLGLYDARGFERFEAMYMLAHTFATHGIITTSVFLSNPSDASEFHEPQKSQSIDPATLTLVPHSIFPRGAFSWLDEPDTGFSPPLRLVNERGDTIVTYDQP
ncbi:MAG: hypothetical protein ACRD37_12420 [Candidatus Acidiferrales bacterium]